jgi:acyl-CoA reductase-like NAD-dependent aldehyde dehydrogenase
MQGLLETAEKGGSLVYRAESDPNTHRMGISLVRLDANAIGPLVEEEIFGPVLPIIAVEVCESPGGADK